MDGLAGELRGGWPGAARVLVERILVAWARTEWARVGCARSGVSESRHGLAPARLSLNPEISACGAPRNEKPVDNGYAARARPQRSTAERDGLPRNLAHAWARRQAAAAGPPEVPPGGRPQPVKTIYCPQIPDTWSVPRSEPLYNFGKCSTPL